MLTPFSPVFPPQTRYHEELHALEEEGEEEDEDGEGEGEGHGDQHHGGVAPYDQDHRARVLVVTGGPWTMEWIIDKMQGEPFDAQKCGNLQLLQMAVTTKPPGHFHFVLIDSAFCGGADTLKTIKETFRLPAVVFADGGEEKVEALREQWGDLVAAVVAAPQQGEKYPGDFKHLLREWHGKFVPHAGKGGHHHAHTKGKHHHHRGGKARAAGKEEGPFFSSAACVGRAVLLSPLPLFPATGGQRRHPRRARGDGPRPPNKPLRAPPTRGILPTASGLRARQPAARRLPGRGAAPLPAGADPGVPHDGAPGAHGAHQRHPARRGRREHLCQSQPDEEAQPLRHPAAVRVAVARGAWLLCSS